MARLRSTAAVGGRQQPGEHDQLCKIRKTLTRQHFILQPTYNCNTETHLNQTETLVLDGRSTMDVTPCFVTDLHRPKGRRAISLQILKKTQNILFSLFSFRVYRSVRQQLYKKSELILDSKLHHPPGPSQLLPAHDQACSSGPQSMFCNINQTLYNVTTGKSSENGSQGVSCDQFDIAGGSTMNGAEEKCKIFARAA